MKKLISIVLAFAILISFTPVAEAHPDDYTDVRVMLAGNPDTGDIYYEKNISEVVPIASVSKLMTYLVAMDNVTAGKVSLEDVITVNAEVASFSIPGYSRFDLVEGQQVKLKDLLVGLLTVSGNDAARAIAIHVAGSDAAFADLMNSKAEELGLNDSKFINSSGLTEIDPTIELPPEIEEVIDTNDEISTETESTEETEEEIAEENSTETTVGTNVEIPINRIYNKMPGDELFQLVMHILEKYPEVEEYGKMHIIEYPERNYVGESSLPLRENKSMIGLKTGGTLEAGSSFVGLFDMSLEDPTQTFKVVTIVLGANSIDERNEASQALLDFVKESYSVRSVLSTEVPYIDYFAEDAVVDSFPLYPELNYSRYLARNKDIETVYKINEGLEAPYSAGQVLGEITILEDGEEVDTINLVSKESYERVKFWEGILNSIQEFFSDLISMY